MRVVSDKAKVLYMLLLIIFLSVFGLFWLDTIGLINLHKYMNRFAKESPSVLEKAGDEPSLIEREEFEKEKQKLHDRVEELDKREALLAEEEKKIKSEREKIEEVANGLKLEKKKFEEAKKVYSGYQKNVRILAEKIGNMPPEDSVKIMVNWEDPLIIDVLRQLDANALEAGQQSITPYLITLISSLHSTDKASRIMYLMTQL